MYRTIDLKNRRTTKMGAHAAYFKLSARRGVRVYGAGEWSSDGPSVTKKELDFYNVREDFKFIQRIQCSIVPRAYEIVAVKLQGIWFPGLIMEHVDGVHSNGLQPGKGMLKNQTFATLMNQIGNEFRQLTGYIHQDLNGFNVIFNRRKKTYKVIDLTLEYATPSERVHL